MARSVRPEFQIPISAGNGTYEIYSERFSGRCRLPIVSKEFKFSTLKVLTRSVSLQREYPVK